MILRAAAIRSKYHTGYQHRVWALYSPVDLAMDPAVIIDQDTHAATASVACGQQMTGGLTVLHRDHAPASDLGGIPRKNFPNKPRKFCAVEALRPNPDDLRTRSAAYCQDGVEIGVKRYDNSVVCLSISEDLSVRRRRHTNLANVSAVDTTCTQFVGCIPG